MPKIIRKHKGINQKTGRLNKGYKYSKKVLKSGLKEILKVQMKTARKKRMKGGYTPPPPPPDMPQLTIPETNCKFFKLYIYI